MPLTQFSFTTQFEKDRTTVVRLPSLSSMVNTGAVVPIVTPQFIPDRRESANVLMGPPPIPTPMPQTSRTSALDMGMNSGSVSVSGPVRRPRYNAGRISPYSTRSKDTPSECNSGSQSSPGPSSSPSVSSNSSSFNTSFSYTPQDYYYRKLKRRTTRYYWYVFKSANRIHHPPELPHNHRGLKHNDLLVHVDESSRAELRGRPVVVDGAFAILDSLQMWIWDGPAGRWNEINFGDDHILAGKTYYLSLYRGLSGGMEPEWVTERGFHNLLREIRSRNELQTEIEHLYATLEEMQSSSEAFNTNTIALVKATQQSLSQMVVHTHNLVAYVNGFKMDFSLKLESNLRQTQLHSSNPRKEISQNRDRIHLILTHLQARSDQTAFAPNSVTQAIAAIHSKEPVIPPNASRMTEDTLQILHFLWLCQEVTKVIVPHIDLSTLVSAPHSSQNLSSGEGCKAVLFHPVWMPSTPRSTPLSLSQSRWSYSFPPTQEFQIPGSLRRKIAEDTRERNLLLQRREVHHKNAYSQIDAQAVTMIESLNRKLGEVEERIRLNAESTASLAVKQLWSQTQNFSDLWSTLLRHLLANSDHMQNASTRIQLAKETLEALQPQPRGVFKNHEPCLEEGTNMGTSVRHPYGCTKECDTDSIPVTFSKEVGQQVADNGNSKSHHDLNSGYPDEVTASNDIFNRKLVSRESPNVLCLMEELRIQDWRNVVHCGETPVNTLSLEHLGERLEISQISDTSEDNHAQENCTTPLVIPEIVQVCSDNENLTISVSKGALQDGGIESSEACDLVSEVGVSQSALVFENSGPQINEEVSPCEPEHSSKEIEDENLDQELPDVSCGLDAVVKPMYDMDSGQTPLITRSYPIKRKMSRLKYLVIVFLLLCGVFLLLEVMKTTVEQWFEEVVRSHLDYRSRRMLRNLGN
ncbi:hypothetical protein GG344DRAFT_80543 [Lentinula edodes]|nr:hypothetical protein GG344DRAFT_80543 [Lentinula edodes]